MDSPFNIIDVVSSSSFSKFLKDWKEQKTFSLSLGCEKLLRDPIGIGPPGGQSERKITHGITVQTENLTITGLAVSWHARDAYFVYLSDRARSSSNLELMEPGFTADVRIQGVRQVLTEINPDLVIIFDSKNHLRLLSKAFGVPILRGVILDPKVADWVLNMIAEEKMLQTLIAENIPSEIEMLEDFRQHHRSGSIALSLSCPGSTRVRSSTESVLARQLMPVLASKLKQEDLLNPFLEIEMPAVKSVAWMELNGMGVSSEVIKTIKDSLISQMIRIEKRATEITGVPVNLALPDDVGKALFGHLKLPPPEEAIQVRRKRTFYSTNRDILWKIKDLHELPMLVLEHRRLKNALSKNVSPIEDVMHVSQGLGMRRIHGICYMNSATGRISMSEPSLQMIPKDFSVDVWEEASSQELRKDGWGLAGRKNIGQLDVSLRNAFVPFPGGVLLSVDYSQLELRILAHLSGDKKLIAALADERDVFKVIASDWKKVPLESVDDEQRQQAKKMCYGIIYGMGAKSLSEQMGVSESDAQKYMTTFKSTYPTMLQYLISIVEKCRQLGYVETICGYRRYLPAINHSKTDLRAQAERQAVNTTVQGSAANLAKSAFSKIDATLSKVFPDRIPHQILSKKCKPTLHGAYFVLQLHDELIYEVVAKDLPQVAEIVRREMRSAIQLDVPLQVKMKAGPTWGTMKPYELSQA